MTTEREDKTSKADRILDSVRLHSPLPGQDYSSGKSFSRLMQRIYAEANPMDVLNRRIRHYRVWSIAATVALLVAMGGWLAMAFEENPSFTVASNNSGVVQNITLADGTAIKLNHHSKLIYPDRFMGDKREIFLEGEAYFDVAHDKRHPFIVRAGELNIKVLGTKFTVNANSQSPVITTTLLEGSVNVSDAKSQLLMQPNQKLMYDVNSGKMQVADMSTDNAEREIRWTQNVWVLSDTPLLDICQRLENLFNIKIIIMDERLINKSFTGEFYTTESLESILNTMQITTPFQYEWKGRNTIVLK